MPAAHLSNHHRDTITAVFAHPTRHNIRWVDIVSLVGAMGQIEEKHDGRFRVTIGPEVEVFDRSHGKDVTMEQIIDLRRMLTHAGLAPEAGTDPGTQA